MGVPAIFLRVGGCNLLCNFVDKHGHGNPCDSIPVWQKGVYRTHVETIQHWKEQHWFQYLRDCTAHLIFTGGEPTMQQDGIIGMYEELESGEVKGFYSEIETNGTHVIKPELMDRLSQINCSPKLASSSMSVDRRYNPAALMQIRDAGGFFKFVVTQEEDMEEILSDFVIPFKIDPRQVYLMPEGVESKELQKKSQWVAELCKTHGFRFSARLHVNIWERVTGV